MKSNLILFLLACVCLASCVSSRSGVISSNSSSKPVVYKDVAYGVAQVDKYFCFGGHKQDASVLEAKREMIKNRPLNKNEEYQNYTIDFKRTYWPLVYSQVKVTVTADVVDFSGNSSQDLYSDVYQAKLIGTTSKSGLFAVGDSVMNSRLKVGTILSLEGNGKIRVLYRSEKDVILTKRVSEDNLFVMNKKYKELETGAYYAIDDPTKDIEISKVTKVLAIGLNELLLDDLKTGRKVKTKY
ncbi:DUF6567 family protein [Labilibacter marinus]|uniref:DUF6567 family protein n=1 Tax=Labilibacter marinus TaxID=1477105 RepID=UPI00082EB54C|nr:DUF6567 family protein [Labilibacter marinus]